MCYGWAEVVSVLKEHRVLQRRFKLTWESIPKSFSQIFDQVAESV
jgi:hypothetical protein